MTHPFKIPVITIPVESRKSYYDHIVSRCRIDPITDCWVFLPAMPTNTGDTSWENKYAYIKYHGDVRPVVRVMFEETQGTPVPDGFEVRHRTIDKDKNPVHCHRRCCNPEHLVLFPVFSHAGKRYKNSKDIPAHMYPMKAAEVKHHPKDTVETKPAANMPKDMHSDQSFKDIMKEFGMDPDSEK